jgi:hypothetical protein
MSESNSGGFPFLPILGLIFITLKLFGVITWAWWIVLLPLYPLIIIWSFFLLILTFAGVCFLIGTVLEVFKK